jgi:hypothetical protein
MSLQWPAHPRVLNDLLRPRGTIAPHMMLCSDKGADSVLASVAPVPSTLAAAAGALAEVAGHHEVRPALVEVALLIAPVLAGRWVITTQFCVARWGRNQQSNIQLQHALAHNAQHFVQMGPRGLCCLQIGSWCPVIVSQGLSTCDFCCRPFYAAVAAWLAEMLRTAAVQMVHGTAQRDLTLTAASHVPFASASAAAAAAAAAAAHSHRGYAAGTKQMFEIWHGKHSRTGTYRPTMGPLLVSVVMQLARACAAGPAAPRCRAVHRAYMAVLLRCIPRHPAHRSHMHVAEASCMRTYACVFTCSDSKSCS